VATKAKGVKRSPDILHHEKKNDWQRLAEHIRENPVLWGAGLLFVLVCLLAGLAFRVNAANKNRAGTTEFARAIGTEEPALRATELEQAAQNDAMAADALYMAGEAAYEAKDYEKAKELFQKLRANYPNFKRVPDAVEAIGFIAENEDKPDAAIDAYQEIIDKWPNSVARRRQEINLARVYEQQEDYRKAVEAYTFHAEHYPESAFRPEVEEALDRLKKEHPDLFPEETAAEETAAEEKALEESAAEEPAPAAQTETPDAPAEEPPPATEPAEQPS